MLKKKMVEKTEHTQVVDLFISFIMCHPDNCYGPMLNLLIVHALEQTFVYRGLTLPRNLIILYEILDFLDIVRFLAV